MGGNLNVKIGDVIRPGEMVTSVIDNSRLWVRIDVPGGGADELRGAGTGLGPPDPSG
jgi:membrane fusion protein (multidrug efflux system)